MDRSSFSSRLIRVLSTVALAAGTTAAQQNCPFLVPPSLQYGTTHCQTLVVNSCDDVHMMIGLPTAPSNGLLVMFHGLSSTELFEGGAGNPNIAGARDRLMDAAMQQGLYVVCVRASCTVCTPPSANYCFTYGGPTMHDHVADAIEYMLATYGLSRRKVFGFGWSMGGADVLSYATRHLDMNGHGAMLAAVWARSPTASVPAVWDVETGNRPFIESALGVPGVTPDDFPLAIIPYAGASTAWIRSAAPSSLDLDLSLAWNLDGRPVMITRKVGDINHVIWSYDGLQAAFAGTSTINFEPPTSGIHTDWSDFTPAKAASVIAFLQTGGPLSYPSSGRTLIVENGTYYGFEVQRSGMYGLARWDWNANALTNQLDVLAASSLARIAFSVTGIGLSTTTKLRVQFDQPSGGNTDVVVRGYTSQPVVRGCGGASIPPNSWEWIPGTHELVFHEPVNLIWCIN